MVKFTFYREKFLEELLFQLYTVLDTYLFYDDFLSLIFMHVSDFVVVYFAWKVLFGLEIYFLNVFIDMNLVCLAFYFFWIV